MSEVRLAKMGLTRINGKMFLLMGNVIVRAKLVAWIEWHDREVLVRLRQDDLLLRTGILSREAYDAFVEFLVARKKGRFRKPEKGA